MSRSHGRPCLLAVLLCLAGSCSVKEDRGDCPVYVTVLTDRFVLKGMNDGKVSFAAAEPIRQEDINFLRYLRDGYVQVCPREYTRTAVLSGVENAMLSGDALFIIPGREAGLVWADCRSFSADADEYVVDAMPHKQFCLVRFLFDGLPTAPPDYPWRFRIRAACSGMNIYTLAPLEGDYRAPVGPNAVGEWYGVIPRQKENNMLLEIYTPSDGGDSEEGKVEYTVDLGRKFEALGYDWSATDLGDVSVSVGYCAAEITVDVQGWEGDESYRDIQM